MRYIRLLIFVLSVFTLPTHAVWAQITLTVQKLDSLKNDAKKLTDLLKDTESQLQNIKTNKLQKEAKAISGELRRNMRQTLAKPTPKQAPTESSASESRNTEAPKLEVPKPNAEPLREKNKKENKNQSQNQVIIAPPKIEKADDVHDMWAELNQKDLALVEQQEKNKEAELIALKQALELQIRANQLQDLRQTNWLTAGGAILLISAFSIGFLVRSNRIRKKNNALLAQERDKSDELLLNILPLTIAEELKAHGKAQPRQYKKASVMFTDFKGFTTVAEKMTPQELIAELDECFAKIDEIITTHRLEKIKTIGDAYMCVGGIPEPNKTNPIDAVLAGLEVQRFMHSKRKERLAEGKEYWFLRLGINTGELVAGVIGKKKFAYDVWGDTVNSASRMESSGEVGKVNISGNTYPYIKDFFVCTHRGKIEAKSKGAVDMYFVESILPELSEKGEGVLPNALFWERVGKV